MARIKRILVAVKDPAARHSAAVAKGAQLARAFGAQLVLFHAITTPWYLAGDISLLGAGLADAQGTIRRACLARLERLRRRMRVPRALLSVQWDYPIHEGVIREAQHTRADLVVAERHRGWHHPRNLLQLTDWELLRLCPVPVLLVARHRSYRRPRIVVALDPERSYGKPAGLDRHILRMGSQLAEKLRGTLHAVHAYAPVTPEAYAHGTSEQELARLRHLGARAAARRLARATRGAGLTAAQLHLVPRHAPDAIEQAARSTGSSLVVMGAISRHGLQRVLVGDTAQRVLDRLACDLLVVKPPARAHRAASNKPRT